MKLKLNKTNNLSSSLKGNLIAWLDSPQSTTGFGVVAKNILKLFHGSQVDIDILGINFPGTFPDKKKFPYTIIPAVTGNRKDPYGSALLLHSLKSKRYDVLFVLNDHHVTHPVAVHIQRLREQIMNMGAEPFKIVYYFPVDCHVLEDWSGMLDIADIKVAYNKYGYNEATKAGRKPDFIINHGVDSKAFHRIPEAARRQIRKEIYKIQDDNTFLWINVNRNSLRKNIAQTIYAFSLFKKKHPNSKLYVHASVIDGKSAGGIDLDLQIPCRELGLEVGQDVMFPHNYLPVAGIPDHMLNQCFNAADGYITTTSGEGWGCSITESMACGVPVVVPDNTSLPEIVGADGVRGYMYPCKEVSLFDSSGYRQVARTEDVLQSMFDCYEERFSSKQQRVIERARQYAEKIDWSNINKQWVKVFQRVFNKSNLAEHKGSKSVPEEI